MASMAQMDHFNATVHNGTLVSTRRGLHVSKTEHHGTRFVNTFAAPASSNCSSTSSSSHAALPVRKKGGHNERQGAKQCGRQQQRALEGKFKFVPKATEREKGAAKGRSSESTAAASTLSTPPDGDGNVVVKSRLGHSPHFIDPSSEILAACLPTIPSPVSTSIPMEWKAYMLGHQLPEPHQRLVHLYLRHVPNQLYPSEELLTYNPVRNPTFYHRINGDALTMQSVLLTAALMDAVFRADASFDALGDYMVNMCAMVNERLRSETSASGPAVVESIAAMAIVSTFMNRGDLWHVHMKGMRHVIARQGGLTDKWGHVLFKVRKADVKGAAYTCDMPYLEFDRLFPPVSEILPPGLKSGLGLTIQRVLRQCGIAEAVVDAIRELASVTQTITLARHKPSRSILFDPQSYAEEVLWVEDHLVRHPGPLRDPNAAAADNDWASQCSSSRDASPDHGYQRTPGGDAHSRGASVSSLPPHSVRPADAENPLEAVARLAGILYIEELLTEPHTVDPYGVLLALLGHHIADIVARLRARQDAFLTGTPPLPPDPSGRSPLDGLPHDAAAMRPLLLWACTVAYAVLEIIEGGSVFAMRPVDRSPYQDCVALALGAACPTDVAALPTEDFELACLLPVRELGLLPCDDDVLLRRITVDYEARQAGTMATFL